MPRRLRDWHNAIRGLAGLVGATSGGRYDPGRIFQTAWGGISYASARSAVWGWARKKTLTGANERITDALGTLVAQPDPGDKDDDGDQAS